MKRLHILLICLLMCIPLCGCSDSNYSSNVDSNDSYNETEEFNVYDVYMHTVDSSCFSEIGYDADYECLVVRFRDNSDPLYVYEGFSQWEYDEFISADSLGSYYNEYIKGKYNCIKYE